jgi:hypothetical protein
VTALKALVVTARHVPRPVALQTRLVESQPERASELVVDVGAIPVVIPAGIEPSTVFRVNEESFTGTHVFVFRDREYFRGAVTRGSLGWPHAHFVPVVEDKSVRTAVLKDCVVILILVELDASVEAGAVLRVPVVALPGAFEDRLRVLSYALYLTLTVDNANNPGDNES